MIDPADRDDAFPAFTTPEIPDGYTDETYAREQCDAAHLDEQMGEAQ